MKNNIVEEEELISLYERYKNGKTLTKLSKEIGIDQKILSQSFKEHGFKMKSGSRTYFLNEDYFSEIDTSNKAYWLGFIAADGCLTKTGGHKTENVLVINLNIRDKEHLEKFAREIEYIGPIKIIKEAGFGKGTTLAKLSLNSIKICNDLKKQGVYPRKSLILKPPQISPDFIKDWIRGYLDGDGSIHVSEKHSHISFCGTLEVLNFIDNFLTVTGEHKKIKRHPESDKNNWQFSIGGTENSVKVLHKIYDNAEIYLTRKI